MLISLLCTVSNFSTLFFNCQSKPGQTYLWLYIYLSVHLSICTSGTAFYIVGCYPLKFIFCLHYTSNFLHPSAFLLLYLCFLKEEPQLNILNVHIILIYYLQSSSSSINPILSSPVFSSQVAFYKLNRSHKSICLMFCKKNNPKGLIWILLLAACCLYLKFSWFSLSGKDNLLLLFTFFCRLQYGRIYSLIQSRLNPVRRYPVTVVDFDVGFFFLFLLTLTLLPAEWVIFFFPSFHQYISVRDITEELLPVTYQGRKTSFIQSTCCCLQSCKSVTGEML